MADLWGVLLGGAIAIVSTIVVKRWEEDRQSTALRAAFAAEISGLLRIVEARKHVAFAEHWVEKWGRGEDYQPQMFGLDKIREDPVFSKNVDKIGLLGSDAADTVLFYTTLEAVRVNFLQVVEGKLNNLTIEQRIGVVQGALNLWRPNQELGRSLIERLQR